MEIHQNFVVINSNFNDVFEGSLVITKSLIEKESGIEDGVAFYCFDEPISADEFLENEQKYIQEAKADLAIGKEDAILLARKILDFFS